MARPWGIFRQSFNRHASSFQRRWSRPPRIFADVFSTCVAVATSPLSFVAAQNQCPRLAFRRGIRCCKSSFRANGCPPDTLSVALMGPEPMARWRASGSMPAKPSRESPGITRTMRTGALGRWIRAEGSPMAGDLLGEARRSQGASCRHGHDGNTRSCRRSNRKVADRRHLKAGSANRLVNSERLAPSIVR